MISRFKMLCLSVTVVAGPAFAQTDDHAGHHPTGKASAPAPPAKTDAATPHCPVMDAAPSGKGDQHQGTSPRQGVQGKGMMEKGTASGRMSPETMKSCMGEHASPPTDHKRSN